MDKIKRKQPMTPERMLSESEDEPTPIPGHNMPRMIDPVLLGSVSKSSNDPLSSFAKNLESNNILREGFDLEELKRKQEDLLLIQQMVQKNIEGIQKQIERCSHKKDYSDHKAGTHTPQYYRKFDESDSDQPCYGASKSAQKKRDLSKSFNKSQNDASFGMDYGDQPIKGNNLTK